MVGLFFSCDFDLYFDTLVQSDAPSTDETLDSRVSAVESAKAFIAGGFGGVSAVLVGEFLRFSSQRSQS